jgi:hypothetical protein
MTALVRSLSAAPAIVKLSSSGLSIEEIEGLLGELVWAARGHEGDVLRGAEERQVYELGRAGVITLFKMGAVWCARRSTLTAELASLERAARTNTEA